MSKITREYKNSKTFYICDCCGNSTDYLFSDWVLLKNDACLCDKCLKDLGFEDSDVITFSKDDFENYISPILDLILKLKDIKNIRKRKYLISDIKYLFEELKKDGKGIPKWILSITDWKNIEFPRFEYEYN